MSESEYPWLKKAGRILNSGQARTILLTGNIQDLFRLRTDEGARYASLVNLLTAKWDVKNKIVLVYELNGPIRFKSEQDQAKVREAWVKWRTGLDPNELAVKAMLAPANQAAELERRGKSFDENLTSAVGNPTVALELLRQFCLCSRSEIKGATVLEQDLIVIVEAADLIVPEGEITRLSDADRHRVSICQDWFSDPGLMKADDAIVLLAESRSLVNSRIARLPQVIEVTIPSPGDSEREALIAWFEDGLPEGEKLRLWSTRQDLAKFTAGLSLHALLQLLKGAVYERETPLALNDVVDKVEEFIQSQLGDDIVEFKKPEHTLEKVIGYAKLKEFLAKELIPRFRSTGPDALPGAAVGGPIGSGKTYIFEAVANELDLVVLVLKNIRSQWFGQTDVIFERLRRVLEALSKVLIFVDEADTQFGGVGPETHDTERRLTGKVQAMMSDPKLRGRVIWLLMTARIHLLSPDIRRPGRVGDLIIPILDPAGPDRLDFIRWTLKPVLKDELTDKQLEEFNVSLRLRSAASFSSLRSELDARAVAKGDKLSLIEVMEIVDDLLPPAIEDTRRYQTLQALTNCTRRSLLPDPTVTDDQRRQWEAEIRALEAKGIR